MNDKYVRKKLVLKKEIKKKISKLLISIIIFLLGMITTKIYPATKELINKKVYEESINVTNNRNIYNKYFSNLFTKEKEERVISNKINYKEEKETQNGVALKVDINSPIPIVESGIIIYINEEEIIIEQIDGVKTKYKNVTNDNNKIYDYLEKGEVLGLSITDSIELSFEKEGEKVDYKKYI